MNNRPLFLPLIGQYHNIGDIILRRPLAKWLSDMGHLHVYTGAAPEGYLRGLQLDANSSTYCSFGRWYCEGLKQSLKTRCAYLFKPGEIQLTMPGMKEHVSVVPLLVWLKLFGGVVARVGSGSRNFSRFYRAVMSPSIYLSDYVLWRDSVSAEFLKKGGSTPDLGFYEGSPVSDFAPAEHRPYLTVSMRGDALLPDEKWLHSVKAFAKNHQLKIKVVTQVTVDSKRSEELAHLLEGEALLWDGSDHDVQEARLREIYRQSAMAVSDRLHVLIAAFTEGAVPAGLLMDGSDKIQRHFDILAMEKIGLPSADLSQQEMEGFLSSRLDQRESDYRALEQARAQLEITRANLRNLLEGVNG